MRRLIVAIATLVVILGIFFLMMSRRSLRIHAVVTQTSLMGSPLANLKKGGKIELDIRFPLFLRHYRLHHQIPGMAKYVFPKGDFHYSFKLKDRKTIEGKPAPATLQILDGHGRYKDDYFVLDIRAGHSDLTVEFHDPSGRALKSSKFPSHLNPSAWPGAHRITLLMPQPPKMQSRPRPPPAPAKPGPPHPEPPQPAKATPPPMPGRPQLPNVQLRMVANITSATAGGF